MARQYITTAIDTPNAPPHMGHVLERILADVIARWFRLRGDEVRFQIGTDEHGLKVQRAAEKAGMTPEEFLKTTVPLFQSLADRLNISYDVFFHTDERRTHWPTVQKVWEELRRNEMLQKRTYTAGYCVGCERFMTARDLVDGKCPDHQLEPEEVSEENWFFLLSKESDYLHDLLTRKDGGYRIVPDFRAKETLALIEQGLEDVSFSRPKSSLYWGFPVPDDEQQTMYVWCDALTNYISGLGYFTDHEEREWWDEAEVTHVIGKDIARFHALIWPAMLKHAGVRTPDRLLIHGFLTSEGQKMSKSLGNVIIPDEVLEKFGGNPDPLRFYLSHEVPVGRDGDFSWERFEKLYDSKLRNNLGNLLNRVLVLLNKDGGDLDQLEGLEGDEGPWSGYEKAMDKFDLSKALQHAVALADNANVSIDNTEPWKLPPDRRKYELTVLSEHLRHIALMLLPFIPETAQEISRQLNVPYADRMLDKEFVITDEMKRFGGQKDWKSVGEPSILFAPLS